MMLDPRVVWDVLDVAQPVDFHDPKHVAIAEAVHRLATRGEGTDPLLVESELASAGDKVPVDYLFGLTSAVPTSANAGYYAEQVRDHAVRRRLALAGRVVEQVAGDRTVGATEAVEKARGALDDLVAARGSKVAAVWASLDETIASLSEPPEMTPTPWASVNHIIGGLRPGAMYVVGARPASGKTTMGLNLAVSMAQAGSVAFCSLEMSEGELQKRLISQTGRVHLSALVNNALQDDDWERVAAARAKIGRMPLFIDDNAAATVATIRGFVRSVSREGPLGGLVVDYVQLLQSPDTSRSRQQIIGEFSRGMKLIAKEFGIPAVVLSQLNRKSEERVDRKPSISDLRESGDLEQDADVVFLLSRDDRDEERKGEGEVEVQIAKNRHGPNGETSLAWLGHYSLMQELGCGWSPGM